MKRLTEVDKSGSWSIAGIKLGNVKGNLYGALCKLKAYEDTGLTPEEIIAGKQIWIPVEERLPEDIEMKLVSCETKKGVKTINRAYYLNGSWHGSGSMSGVIAWMPLPEAYQP